MYNCINVKSPLYQKDFTFKNGRLEAVFLWLVKAFFFASVVVVVLLDCKAVNEDFPSAIKLIKVRHAHYLASLLMDEILCKTIFPVTMAIFLESDYSIMHISKKEMKWQHQQ